MDRNADREAVALLEAQLGKCQSFSDWARVTHELAHLYRFKLKDQGQKAADYALLAGRAYIADGRLAPAVAMLKWIAEVEGAHQQYKKLERWLDVAVAGAATRVTRLKNRMPRFKLRLEKYSVFEGLSQDQIRKLLRLSTVRDLKPASTLFKEGDDPLAFYVVASGEMQLESSLGIKKTFKEGDFFGELALFGGTKRTATLKTRSGAKLLVFSEVAMRESFKNWPAFPKTIFRFFNLRLFLNAAKVSPFFKGFSETELEECFSFFKPVMVSSGKVILLQGDLSECLYLIVRGQVQISRGTEMICRLGSGQFIGEMGLLKKKPRSATVTAISETVLLKSSETEFQKMMKRFPKLLRHLENLAESRLSAGREKFVQYRGDLSGILVD